MIELSDNPDLGPEPGWTESDMNGAYYRFQAQTSFTSGDPDSQHVRMRYYHAERRDELLAKVWFGPKAEGPPRHAHGGSSAAVLDEIMGYACWMNGHPVVAAELTIRYRRPIPLRRIVQAFAVVVSVDGRKVKARGKVFDQDGEYVESEGLFVVVGKGKFAAFAEP